MKDPRQGAAASVFLVFYVLAFVFTVFCLFTRRGKRHIFCVFSFNLIRIGANIAALGWAIHLYDNFNWLIASLILGTEGKSAWHSKYTPDVPRLLRARSWYPVSCLTRLWCDADGSFIIVGYEKEAFGTSLFYPDIPEGRSKCMHRFTHVSFWFEWSKPVTRILDMPLISRPDSRKRASDRRR